MSKFTLRHDVLRVLTLNAWFRLPLEVRSREIAAWIEVVQPHIVCLQEIRKQDWNPTLADWLAEQCSGTWNIAYGGYADEEGFLSGNAILSRWPIEASETIPLPCADSRPKLLLFGRTKNLDVFCVHLTSDPAGALVRETQVTFIDEVISSTSLGRSPLPPILAGDFNAPPGSSAIRFLRGESPLGNRSTFFQDAWAVAGTGPGLTWHHDNPHVPPAHLFDARCDYVFVGLPKVPLGWNRGENPNVVPVGQVVGAYLACDSPLTGTYASDHYAVVADIAWPGVPSL